MTREEWLNLPSDWRLAFKKSRELNPQIFQHLAMTDVPLPLRKHAGAIVSDCRLRYWLCEVDCRFGRNGSYQGKILTPIYGPWEGRRPDMIAMNEFETVMDDALKQIKARRKAA